MFISYPHLGLIGCLVGDFLSGNTRNRLLISVALPSSTCGTCRMGRECGRLYVGNWSFLSFPSPMPIFYKKSKVINISLRCGFMSISHFLSSFALFLSFPCSKTPGVSIISLLYWGKNYNWITCLRNKGVHFTRWTKH